MRGGFAGCRAAWIVLALLVAVGCGGEGDPKLGLNVLLYGPPKAQFPDQDPFANCAFVKLCYKVVGETKLKECQVFPYQGGFAEMPRLPLGDEIVLVAECLDQDATGSPMNVLSRGQSTPVQHDKGEGEETVGIYMLPVSSFGPTYSPGDLSAGGPGQVTTTTTPRYGAAAVELFDGNILLAGGVKNLKSGCDDWSSPKCIEKSLATCELYNPADGTFSLVESPSGLVLMTEKRAFAAAVELPSGEIAVFGGITENGEATNSVDIYDPIGPGFIAGPPMTDTRAFHTATLISSAGSGFVLLAGGYGTGEETWEVWTPDGVLATDKLTSSRWRHTATHISKKLDPSAREVVIIAGGEGGGEPGSTTVRDDMEIFDVAAQMFDPEPVPLCSNQGETSPAPAKKTLHAAAFVPKRHFLYVAGGFSDPKHQSPTKDICVWHTVQEKWSGESGTFLLKKGRGGLTATALPGNVVLLAGGLTKKDQTLQVADTVEIVFEYLNDKGETVVDIGPGDAFPIPMLYPRWDHGAIPTADGKVLFFGGLKGLPTAPTMVEETEAFNPQ
jgi:hypothetical protein